MRKPKLAESFLATAIMGIVLVQNIAMLDVWDDVLARIESVTRTGSYAVNHTLAFAVAVRRGAPRHAEKRGLSVGRRLGSRPCSTRPPTSATPP